jgi:hypothetical protein
MRGEMKILGHIGSILVKLDISDPEHPELILNDNAQAEHLAALLSTEPLVIDWLDDTTDHIVLRLAYTPDMDHLIVDLIDVLISIRYAIPGIVQLSLLEGIEEYDEPT